jgi:hypothetical protein
MIGKERRKREEEAYQVTPSFGACTICMVLTFHWILYMM